MKHSTMKAIISELKSYELYEMRELIEEAVEKRQADLRQRKVEIAVAYEAGEYPYVPQDDHFKGLPHLRKVKSYMDLSGLSLLEAKTIIDHVFPRK